MPNPTASDVHVDRPLTNMAMNYMQDQDKYFADQVFPYIGVDKQGGKYFEFDKDDLLRNEAEEWVAGTETAGSGYRVDSSNTYSTTTYGFHKDIGDDVRANADDPLAPDENATRFVTQKLLIQKERHFGSTFIPELDNTDGTSETPWSYGIDVANDSGGPWGAPSTGTPMDHIFTYAHKVEKTWSWPNVAVMGAEVYEMLIRHDDFTDLYKHTRPGMITKDLLADSLDLDRIFVGRSVYASNDEGASATTTHCIAPDQILLLWVPDNPQIDIPSAGYTFGWEGLAGADGRNIVVRDFRIDKLAVDRVEGKLAYDMKATSGDLGAILVDTLSSGS